MQDNISYTPASQAAVDERAAFIWKAYAHVALGLLAFAAVLGYVVSSGLAMQIAEPMLNYWWATLGAFILVGWIASHLAHTIESVPLQYAAFALVVVAYALITSPMILVAMATQPPGTIESAAWITLLGSGGLMATAMITRKDFSFLRGMLVWGGILALIGIFSSLIFGFQLGTWFSVAMIGFAGAAVLYDTSNIIHHYPTTRYVAAGMALFSSIALMFWYVLRLLMSRE